MQPIQALIGLALRQNIAILNVHPTQHRQIMQKPGNIAVYNKKQTTNEAVHKTAMNKFN